MIALYLASLAMFVAYIAAILCRFGVPASISESYYLWSGKSGKPLFYGFCVLTALPLLIFWLEISPEQGLFLVFLACAPLAFVGAAGAFKEIDLTGRVHFASAGISALASQLWIMINTRWWIGSLALLVIAFVVEWKIKGRDANGYTVSAWLFFVEIAAFLSVYIALMAYYISGGQT